MRELFLKVNGLPGNQFSGSVIMNQPTQFYIAGNWITNIIIHDTSLLGSNCDISNNPLLGTPEIFNLTACMQSGLYSANALPNTATTFKYLTCSTALRTTVKTYLSLFPSTVAKNVLNSTASTRYLSTLYNEAITLNDRISYVISMIDYYPQRLVTKISATQFYFVILKMVIKVSILVNVDSI